MEYIILYWNWVQNLHLHPRDFHVFLCLILFCLLYRNSCFILVIMFDRRDKLQSMMPKATPLAKTSLRFYMNPTPEAKDLYISISWSLTVRSGRWIYTILRESFTWWSSSSSVALQPGVGLGLLYNTPPNLSIPCSVSPFVYSHLSQVHGHVIQQSHFWSSSSSCCIQISVHLFWGLRCLAFFLYDQAIVCFGI